MAVRQYGHARFTEYLDILTTPIGLRKIHDAFGGRGINPRATGLRKKLIESEHRVNIDVITSGERAGSQASPIVFPEPSGPGFVSSEGILYPTLEKLIEFKLASHIWGKRLQDIADVVKLIQVNHLTEPFGAKLHPAVQAKFAEAIQAAREEVDRE